MRRDFGCGEPEGKKIGLVLVCFCTLGLAYVGCVGMSVYTE